MIHIGIVDDNEFFLNLLSDLLYKYFTSRSLMCKVDCFPKSAAFYYEITENDIYDICFLDIEMPELNGIELAKKIRKSGSNTSLIFITAHSEFIRKGYEVRAFDYLAKDGLEKELPLVMDRLLDTLEESKKRSTL